MDAIIFSRVWNAAFIEIALKNARLHCPGCRIVHHHDAMSAVGWDDTWDVSRNLVAVLDEIDEHAELLVSSHPDMERASLGRWLLLWTWMIENKAERVCFCDSDVLLFDNPFNSGHIVNAGLPTLSGNGAGMVHAGHSVISIGHLCQFIYELRKFVSSSTVHGNLHDMGIWTRVAALGYNEQNKVIDGVAFDHHMGWTEGIWEADEKGYKKITWNGNKPYCRHFPTGEDVRLLNLHCWGDAEFKMREYARMGGLDI